MTTIAGDSHAATIHPPLQQFLEACHARFAGDEGGKVADYIPELTKVDPDHFGISLATIDGHVYEVGDTEVPFTIQSMSKPFVFALALDSLGAAAIEAVIGVEPSGDAFNSIRLNADNKPFNAMVNAGPSPVRGCSSAPEARGPSSSSGRASAALPGVTWVLTRRSTPPSGQPAIANRAIGYLLRNSACCGAMSVPCSTSTSGSARSW